MGRLVDSVIAYRILRMLTIPFIETDAYKLGIINAKGKELKPMRSLNSVNERDAYTILHRMIFRIKRIIEKVPVDNKKLVTFAAALSLVKENYQNNCEPIDLELQYINRLKADLTEEIKYVVENLHTKRMICKSSEEKIESLEKKVIELEDKLQKKTIQKSEYLHLYDKEQEAHSKTNKKYYYLQGAVHDTLSDYDKFCINRWIEDTKRYGPTIMDSVRYVYCLGRINWLGKDCSWVCNHTYSSGLGYYLSVA